MSQDDNTRQIMALYYAYGRKDGGSTVDPLDFSEHYLAIYRKFATGEVSFMPSVQDAFARYATDGDVVKQPIGMAPSTVTSVAVMREGDTVVHVFVDRLVAIAGPADTIGRHAWLLLTANQAEALLYELASKLHIDVVRNDDEPVA